ncbi:HET-domain-containing protein [Penicillium malachiteum]|nr:HET-domain-containing protein [Penicillium malachiteum]
MRAIYAQASCVIVWLGGSIDDRESETALKMIHRLAEYQYREEGEWFQDDFVSAVTKTTRNDSCLKLLQRPWFQRIWVLQEIGVARPISVVCGSVEINGHVFFEGVGKLRQYMPVSICAVFSLIKDAILRPSYEVESHGAQTLGELLDMYHNHHATKLHDKVYALLGLSAEDASQVSLKPNYRLQWNDVFKQVAMHLFPTSCSVETWPETPVAVVKGKGWVLGYVQSVESGTYLYNHQQIKVVYNPTALSMGCEEKWGTVWTLQTFAESIQENDTVCLLKGALSPTVLKLCNDHFRVVVSTTTVLEGEHIQSNGIPALVDPAQDLCLKMESLNDIHMTWAIPLADKECNGGLKDPRNLVSLAPDYQETASEKAKRLYNVSIIRDGMFTQKISTCTFDDYQDQLEYLLEYRHGEERLPVSEGVLKTAAASPVGAAAMLLLLKHYPESLPMSQEVVKITAANPGYYALMIMEILIEHYGERLPMSQDVINTAVATDGRRASKITQLILEHYGGSLSITEDVVRIAVANTKDSDEGPKIIKLLFEFCGHKLPISENLIKVAATNTGGKGPEIMQLLLEYYGDSLVPTSGDVVEITVANTGDRGPEILLQLLKYYGKSLPIPADVVKTALTNSGDQRLGFMQLLLEYRGDSLLIPEDVLKKAVLIKGACAVGIIQLLLQHRGENLPISEDVLKEAVLNRSPWGHEIVQMLLDYYEERLPITDALANIAVSNRSEPKIVQLLLEHRGKNLTFGGDMAKIAS